MNVEIQGKVFNIAIRSNPKDLDSLSKLLADVHEVHNLFRSRYGDINCLCSVDIRKIAVKIEKDNISLIQGLLEGRNVKFRIIIRTKQ